MSSFGLCWGGSLPRGLLQVQTSQALQTSCLYQQLHPLGDLKCPFPGQNILILSPVPRAHTLLPRPLPACPIPSHQMDLPWTSQPH